eukprot:403375747
MSKQRKKDKTKNLKKQDSFLDDNGKVRLLQEDLNNDISINNIGDQQFNESDEKEYIIRDTSISLRSDYSFDEYLDIGSQYRGNREYTGLSTQHMRSFRVFENHNIMSNYNNDDNLQEAQFEHDRLQNNHAGQGGYPVELLPLGFIVLVTMLKDIYEDRKRHLFDNEENIRLSEVYDLETKQFKMRRWRDLKVGDVIRVQDGENIAADILLVKSSDKSRVCYIETKNLDGETNLKEKHADKLLSSKISVKRSHTIADLKGKITCDDANDRLFQFEGAYYFEKYQKRIPLNSENLVLRGCTLKNTRHIIGIIVYTGHDTKIFRNQQNSKFKMSGIQKGTNRQIVIVVILQICLCLFASGYGTIWNTKFFNLQYDGLDQGEQVNYLGNKSVAYLFFVGFGNWILIFTNFIPISLLVTLELVKFFQAAFMQWEVEMYDVDQDIPASVQASNLNEELGQVEYVFSDKTGTMTCNVMQFRKFSAGAYSYGQTQKNEEDKDKHFNFKDENFEKSWLCHGENYQNIREVLVHMAVCHTVIYDQKHRKFNGPSPDEVALVHAAQRLGVEFQKKDDQNNIHINMKGYQMCFKLLQILEFSSSRQRMSVIVRDSQGQIVMYTKGADSIISQRLDKSIRNHNQITMDYATQYAREGLRTLILCKKVIEQQEYDQWYNQIYLAAFNRDVGRDQALEQAYEQIEQRLCVIGCTAIEDKLQEGVDKTIQFMREAGIKVWVLTGDKVETAINIGQSSGLLDQQMKIFKLTQRNYEDNFTQLKALEDQIRIYERIKERENLSNKTPSSSKNHQSHSYKNMSTQSQVVFDVRDIEHSSKLVDDQNIQENINSNRFDDLNENQSKVGNQTQQRKIALILSGEALALINSQEEGREKLLEICDKVSVVLACRVTPKQKSEIVSMIRKRFPTKTTLSIGDGANDVNMITTAHVGVGIAGLEGQQAARCADFVIGQFRFLKPLLFIHGREAYRRNSFLVCYNFYKNVVFVLAIFWFGFLSGMSGQTIYDSFIYQLFNIIFTSVPIMYYSVFVFQYESKDYYLEHPETYYLGINHSCFGTKIFWQWIIYGAFQAALIMATSLFHIWLPDNEQSPSYRHENSITYPIDIYSDYDIWTYGTLIYGMVVIVTNLRIMYSYHVYTFWGELLIFLSILSFFLTVVIASFLKSSILKNDLYGVIYLYNDFGFFLKLFFVTLAFPLIDIICGNIVNLYRSKRGLLADNNNEQFNNLSAPFQTRQRLSLSKSEISSSQRDPREEQYQKQDAEDHLQNQMENDERDHILVNKSKRLGFGKQSSQQHSSHNNIDNNTLQEPITEDDTIR